MLNHPSSNLSILLLFASIFAFVSPQTTNSTLPPNFSINQTVIAGSFSGISTSPPFISSDPQTSTSLQLTGNNVINLNIQTDKNEFINAGCTLNYAGKQWFVTGGYFSQINNVPASSIFASTLDGDTNYFLNGIDGEVFSLLCDSDNGIVWLGGKFSNPNYAYTKQNISNLGYWGGGLIGFNFSQNAWIKSPWQGLDGPVYSLSQNSDNDIIWVGGDFNSTLDGPANPILNAQPVNLIAQTISSGNDFLFPSNSDPRNAICKGNSSDYQNPWLTRDLMDGYIRFTFTYPIAPVLIRILNANFQGRGTKTVRFERTSDNSPIQVSYIDPTTTLEQFCTNECPLLLTSTEWQEFKVSSPSLIDGLTVKAVSWYGQGGGFSGIEVFQQDAVVNANSNLNFPPCATQTPKSQVSASGSWALVGNSEAGIQYLKSDAPTDKVKSGIISTSLTAYPYLPSSGFYDIYLDIPSCIRSNDCDSRANADVQLVVGSGNNGLLNATISQSTLVDTSVLLYTGYVPASSSLFRSFLKISFSSDIPNSVNSSTVSLLFERVRYVRKQSFSNLNSVFGFRTDSTLVGLSQPTYGTLKTPLPNGSVVNSITSLPNAMLLAGSIQSPSKNIVFYQNGRLVPVPNKGVDGTVQTTTFVDNTAYIGGVPSMVYSYNNSAVVAGKFGTVAALEASGVATLQNNSTITSATAYGSTLLPNGDGILRVNAAAYHSNNGASPALAVGGLFGTLSGSSNVAYVIDDLFVGLGSGVSGEVLAIAPAGSYLFIGGKATSGSNPFGGVAIWNMNSKSFVKQVPSLNTGDSNPIKDVYVSSFAVRPSTSMVIVGGNFDTAGSLTCVGVCTWDINEMRWSPLSSKTLNGYVSSLLFYQDDLLLSGNFVNGTTTNSVLLYDFTTDTFSPLPAPARARKRDTQDAANLPSQVSSMAQTGDSPLYVLGSNSPSETPFISSYDLINGVQQLPAFSADSKVDGVSVIQTSTNSDGAPSYSVFAQGSFNTNSGKPASSVVLVNNQWVPYLYSVNSDGSSGSLSNLVSMSPSIPVIQRTRMKTIWVVLIALAISLFLVFLIVLSGLLYIYYKNRNESSTANTSVREKSHLYKSGVGAATGVGAAAAVSRFADSGTSRSNPSSHATSIISRTSSSNSIHSVSSPFIQKSEPAVFMPLPGSSLTNNQNNETPQVMLTEARSPSLSSKSSFDSSFSRSSEFLQNQNYLNEPTTSSTPGPNRTITRSPVSFFSENEKTHQGKASGSDFASSGLLFKPIIPVSTIPKISSDKKQENRDISYGDESTIKTGLLPGSKKSIGQKQETEIETGDSSYRDESTVHADLLSSSRKSVPIRDSLKGYPMYYAKFTFSSREAGELGFKAGERVFVIDKSDEIWWMGIVDHGPDQPLEQGVFPATYISSSPPSPSEYDH
ncbi:hypothetical protein BB559_000298 [Furculomyces boomerangus]|uniref:SH3 domain-containing protein n=1 Tax=Furculomyces boomerangus TaxID=61424 RepID=A0A2T9Z5N0_9FUNG|nr:hypothetical protein BB559_000298 [Furculomyces boomerangus]